MGAWGVALYSDDFAMDVRGDYRDALKFGRTDEDALQEVLRKDAPHAGMEDEYVFWYALADTMWNYGRLTPEVRDKALQYLETIQEDDRWDTPQTWEKRKQVLNKLKEKLLSEQPPRKHVSPYPKYRCPWKLGDIFAYQMHKEVSEKYGMKGKYIIFRKITEEWSWPDNIVPVVQFYKWIGDEIPTIDEIKRMPVLLVTDLQHHSEKEKYLFSIDISSQRILKQQHYQYLGNIQDEQLFERTASNSYEGKATNVFEDVFFSWFMIIIDGQCVFRDDVPGGRSL